jgi:hypothetical protein
MLCVYYSAYKSRCCKNVKRYDVGIPTEMWDEIFYCVKPKELFTLSCVNKKFNEILSSDKHWKNVIHSSDWYDKLLWHDKWVCDELKMVGKWKIAAKTLVYGLTIQNKNCEYVVKGDEEISAICKTVNRGNFNDLEMSMLIKTSGIDHVTYKIKYVKIITFSNGVRHKIKITSTASNPTIEIKIEETTLLQLLMKLGCLSSIYKIDIL